MSVDRNASCPCGSGRKHKNCCLRAVPRAAPARTGRRTVRDLIRSADQELRQGRRTAAVALAEQARGATDDPSVQVAAGRVFALAGRPHEAIAAFEATLERAPGNLDARVLLASTLQLIGRSDEAIDHARAATESKPRNAAAHAVLAACLERRNRLEEAREAAERAVAVDPDHIDANLMLAGIERRLGDAPRAVERLSALLGRSELSTTTQRAALNERGFALEACGQYEEAWASFVAYGVTYANEQSTRAIDRDFWPRRMRAYGSALATVPEAPRVDDGMDEPIFLVGFPRSGTTLVEQILAAHPQIVTSGEQPIMTAVRRALADRTDSKDVARQLELLDAEAIGALRRLFREEAERGSAAGLEGRRFVSKQPIDLIDLPLIGRLFPTSPVIVVERDPRDVCLSCFQQPFMLNEANVHFLAPATTIAFHRLVIDHWLAIRDGLPVTPHIVRYEKLVEDMEGVIGTVLTYLGLEWDDGLPRFHEAARDRFVSTPSYASVGDPVHARAVGKWREYRTSLAPFEADLAHAIEALGYVPAPA